MFSDSIEFEHWWKMDYVCCNFCLNRTISNRFDIRLCFKLFLYSSWEWDQTGIKLGKNMLYIKS